MQEWGWRVPFVLGGLIGPLGWYLRRRMLAAAPRLFAAHPRALVCGGRCQVWRQ